MMNELLLTLTKLAADRKAADMLAQAAEELTGTAQLVDRASKSGMSNEPLALALQIVTQDILEQADIITEALRIVNKSLGSKPM